MGNDLEREWKKLLEREERYFQAAERKREGKLKQISRGIEEKIPNKLLDTLETAFYKAFFVVFEKGTGVIEKTFKGEDIALEFQVNDFRMEKKPTKKSLRKLEKTAKRSKLLNSCITTAEGIGLGAVGIGLPDIPVFLGMILKGIYETAVSYGYDYNKKEEQIFILRLIFAALAEGGEKRRGDEEVEAWVAAMEEGEVSYVFEDEVRKASSALSAAMLTAKFVQGFFIVGAIGGAANPVVYHKISEYANMKYKKRYLNEKRIGV